VKRLKLVICINKTGLIFRPQI